MTKKLRRSILLLLLTGCVEPYEFVVRDEAPALVIEAQISDKSFNDTRMYPSDGRYFTVKLTLSGDVTNRRPVPVSEAVVQLVSASGHQWVYEERDKGIFYLTDPDFKAQPGEQYKLRVALADESVFESDWQALPEVATPEMGEIGFEETEKQLFVMEANEWVVRSFQIVQANVHLPPNDTGSRVYYRWTYAPTWIYIAPLSSSAFVGHICWATDPYYLSSFDLQSDLSGGYDKELFFFRTIRNERIFEKFSVLITQYAMTQDYYNFWREMKDQNESTAMIDKPPFNLETNFAHTGDRPVIGYFGVVNEQAKRWYFGKSDLSYTVVNTLRADCLVNYGGPPAPECLDCREYSFGAATTAKPVWWE